MSPFIVGTSAYPDANLELIREAGIGWSRQRLEWPFQDRVGGELTEEYRLYRATVQNLAAHGMQILGVTPILGIGSQRPGPDGHMQRHFNPKLPDWVGAFGSREFYSIYEETCAWVADDLRDTIRIWQIANELDISPFAGPLNPRQACDLIEHAARGLKRSDPSLQVGHNPTAGRGKTNYFLGFFYGVRDAGLLDYCGLDGYYGTWQPGGPESWAERIDEVHALTSMPILVNEWGFASRGAVMTPEEAASGVTTCELKKWKHSWGPGHTPEGQAAFVEAAFDVLCSRRDKLIGTLFYRWEDQPHCWSCGEPDCPAETAWGLVDIQGRPKPAWVAFKHGAARFQAAD